MDRDQEPRKVAEQGRGRLWSSASGRGIWGGVRDGLVGAGAPGVVWGGGRMEVDGGGWGWMERTLVS